MTDRDQPAAARHDVDVELGRAWRDHRRHLLDIAFRMLGNLSEAEDAVQEAFADLIRADLDSIDDVGGWLVVVVSRRCFDKMRAERRHPTFPAVSLGDRPVDHVLGDDPADRVSLDDNVRIALQLMLERLTPAERTAFVLHDVFQYPYEAVAEIVGRTPAACRQLTSRARRTIAAEAGDPDRFRANSEQQRHLTERFIAACTTGDLEGLIAILDPDVAGIADVGGAAGTVVVTGRDEVAPRALLFLGPRAVDTLLPLPAMDGAGILAMRNGRLVMLIALRMHDDRIDHLDSIVDPVKLQPIAKALGIRTPDLS